MKYQLRIWETSRGWMGTVVAVDPLTHITDEVYESKYHSSPETTLSELLEVKATYERYGV